MGKVTTIMEGEIMNKEVRVNRNVTVIIPDTLETISEMVQRCKFDDIKAECEHDEMRHERRMRNRSKNYVHKFGNLLSSVIF